MIKIFGQIDSGELAARLGGLSLSDRRGSYVWYDDFEAAATKWAHVTPGTGDAIELSTARCFTGSQSMKLTSPDSTLVSCAMERYFTLPPNTRIGVECMFMPNDSKMLATINVSGYDGSAYYIPAVRVNFDTDVVQYYNSAAAWTTIEDDLGFFDGINMWLFVKLVFDWDTKKYVRLMVGKEEYDLSAQSMRTSGSGLEPFVNIAISATPTENANHILYVDNVILTQNEP